MTQKTSLRDAIVDMVKAFKPVFKKNSRYTRRRKTMTSTDA